MYHITDCFGKVISSYETKQARDLAYNEMREAGLQVGHCDDELAFEDDGRPTLS